MKLVTLPELHLKDTPPPAPFPKIVHSVMTIISSSMCCKLKNEHNDVGYLKTIQMLGCVRSKSALKAKLIKKIKTYKFCNGPNK